MIGTQEAVFNAIPIIGIPIYADQYNNLLQAEEKGFGKILKYEDISEKYLESVILEVLNNDSYKKKALEISQRFKDRPMTPLDTAMFWLEYLLRNNNAEALKNPALELSWFEYLMLDVYVIALLFVIAICYLICKTTLLIKSVLFSKEINHDKKNK